MFFAFKALETIRDLLPMAQWLWAEVPIRNHDGMPQGDGINVGNSVAENLLSALRSVFGADQAGVSRPDYLIRQGAPTDISNDPTYIIGDFKTSAQTLLLDYVSPQRKLGQWQSIVNHSRKRGIRVAVFITWNPTNVTALAKLAEKGLEDGEFVYVVSLR